MYLKSCVFKKGGLSPQLQVGMTFIDYLSQLKFVSSYELIAQFAIVWWFIWYARISISFRQESFSPAKLGIIIRAYIKKLGMAGESLASTQSL